MGSLVFWIQFLEDLRDEIVPDIAKMNREDPKTPDSAIPAIEIMATAAAKVQDSFPLL